MSADETVRAHADLVVRATSTLASLNSLIARVQDLDMTAQPRKAAEVVAASDRLLAGIDDMIRRINETLDTLQQNEDDGRDAKSAG